MPLPDFNQFGDLPAGIHDASLGEIEQRFGGDSVQRKQVTQRLRRIYDLALATGGLDRLLVFGSYVSDTPVPNDVDVILVMHDDFKLSSCSEDSIALFDHERADAELGASVFWVRPEMLMGESIATFLEHWQVKRDGALRGIVQVRI